MIERRTDGAGPGFNSAEENFTCGEDKSPDFRRKSISGKGAKHLRPDGIEVYRIKREGMHCIRHKVDAAMLQIAAHDAQLWNWCARPGGGVPRHQLHIEERCISDETDFAAARPGSVQSGAWRKFCPECFRETCKPISTGGGIRLQCMNIGKFHVSGDHDSALST